MPHIESELSRGGFHLGGHELLPATARPVGLRDNGDDMVRRLRERPQGGNGERRRAEEEDAHGLPLAGALTLADLPDNHVALEAAQAIEKQDAVQMIDLML